MPPSGNTGLSKSLILKGLQCSKALWLTKNPPAFELPPKPDQEALFRSGTEVGILARHLFPEGVEVPFEGLSIPAQLARTRELIANGAKVIYEAAFSFSAIFIKVDILVRDGDFWQIHEVKMSTGVKQVHLDDAAIQHYVLEGCGLRISKTCLVHIDTFYRRQGQIDVGRLFASKDITTKVRARQQSLPEIVAACRQTLREYREPEVDIGPHCTDPYECNFIPYCWQHIPAPSVFDLRGKGIDRYGFYRRGLVRFEQLPLAELPWRQRQQVEALLERKNCLDHAGLERFLDSLWYPLCHLDFESISTPIPLFERVSPYQQIPFQFSVHIQREADGHPEHHEFLASPGEDPRCELARKLLAVIPPESCVLVYNKTFEKGILEHLAEQCPGLSHDLETLVSHLHDLMDVFRQRVVYCWQVNGSYSLKDVVPALVPELSYQSLEIADGQVAMRTYLDMGRGEDENVLEKKRRALLEYCRLDTLAMVKIMDVLKKTAREPEKFGEDSGKTGKIPS